MSSWTCVTCARTLGRMRNSALCKRCWQALTEQGLRWCPKCQQPRPMFTGVGYCKDCRCAIERARTADPVYRAHKVAKAKARRHAMIERCAHCGKALSRRQVNNSNRCCSLDCARAWKAKQPRNCAQCGAPLTDPRRRFCGMPCVVAHVDAAPPPVVAPEPVQQATGHILGREPSGAVYVLGDVNGRPMVFQEWHGRRTLHCALSGWETSAAYRRVKGTAPVSVFDEVRVNPWRHYPREAE